MIVYYCITSIANILAVFIFYKNINITVLSVVPLCLIALMLFQARFFKNEPTENGFRTNYGSNLTTNEANQMMKIASAVLFATIPWMIPFVFFFPSPIKLFSILVYIIGLVGGLVFYRMKNRNAIQKRLNTEELERREQEKKEQLGQWK